MATVGVGSAATRVINLSHWTALRVLRALVCGACAVRPTRAECAADTVAGLKSRRISFDEDVSASVLLACG